MQNITRLKIWPQLASNGFEPIKFKAHGKTVAIGAALRKKHIDMKGKEFYSDIICIEPHSYRDKRNYHITGEVKTPFFDHFTRYDDNGRKEKLCLLRKTINQHFKAGEIIKIITLMLS